MRQKYQCHFRLEKICEQAELDQLHYVRWSNPAGLWVLFPLKWLERMHGGVLCLMGIADGFT